MPGISNAILVNLDSFEDSNLPELIWGTDGSEYCLFPSHS